MEERNSPHSGLTRKFVMSIMLQICRAVNLGKGWSSGNWRYGGSSRSFARGPVASGEIVTLFGTGLGPALFTSAQVTSENRLATSLAGTRVMFDGEPVPQPGSKWNGVGFGQCLRSCRLCRLCLASLR
jgi:hypothetical protein